MPRLDAKHTRLRPWYLRLHDLMPFRVREILLVSSAYDAFILEEDGPLTELLFTQYSELNLSWSPRITHATNGLKAMELLGQRWFDLVIAMPRLEDTNVTTLGRMVKRHDPNIPVVVLGFSESDLERFPGGIDSAVIDNCFLWTGDARILITINKLTEDRRNIEHDTELIGVPAIIVVEDSARHASLFLTELYSELMLQSHSLVAEGVNNLHKLLRMRARPKVIHARTYEEALAYYRRLKDLVFAVISDVEYSRGGKIDPEAGFSLVQTIHEEDPDLPVLLQSADIETAQRAADMGVMWIDKRSPSVLRQLRQFVSENLGFGDFIFRTQDKTEVGRARDMYQMEQILQTVPDESLAYHTSRHDLAMWFTARSMFDLASLVRPQTLAEIGNIGEARKFLLDLLKRSRLREQDGRITDFSSRPVTPESSFVRIGTGSIGGKARGIAFANAWLVQNEILDKFDGLNIRIPKTVVIGTEDFDLFVERNGIDDDLDSLTDDAKLLERFLAGRVSDEFRDDLEQVWQHLQGPLAVRSSSLLEDLQFQPFSGVYATYMLPNNHPDRGERLQQLCQAIKAVYASTFCENARDYIGNTAFRPEEEKMAVVIQEMVGQETNGRFYPHISGVALSYNFYPVEGQKPDEGQVFAALGLGHMVVSGGTVLRFCPASPGVLPQFKSASDYSRFSQREFYAVDMSNPELDFTAGIAASLRLHDLAAAEEDGTLGPVGSVYSPDDDTVRDNLKLPGPRIVTLNNVLKWQAIPLAPALSELLRVLGHGMGCAIEIEWAVDMGDWGKPTRRGQPRREPTLYVLQIRPLATHFLQHQIDMADLPASRILCRTEQALGHGVLTDVRDLVYVRRDALVAHTTDQVAVEVATINHDLKDRRIPYVLIGPGRWGSSDPRLGIPVEWRQISGARVIAETPIQERKVEPSQGTHFFHNITSLGVGYLTLDRVAQDGAGGSYIDMDWLDSQPAHRETGAVRHLRFDEPVNIYLDGRRGQAAILRPGAQP